MRWDVEITIEWSEEVEAPTQDLAEQIAKNRAHARCGRGDVQVEAFPSED
jgi:hypothetical protein